MSSLTSRLDTEEIAVTIRTAIGDIDIVLYPQCAPKSVSGFLAYVDGGYYNNACFYRATESPTDEISVVQGGILPRLLSETPEENWPDISPPLPPVEHETTVETGMDNKVGVIALGRLEPGTAGSEFFINMADNEVLDSGVEHPQSDGHGYATFGRVVRGMDILTKIQGMERGNFPPFAALDGQVLSEPVAIECIVRSA